MKHKIDLENWNRREHFNFFKQFELPYYGVTVSMDCTRAYARAKEMGVSFYSYYLHKTLTAANAVENFRYRIEGDELYIYDRLDVSATVLREDHTFGFSFMPYQSDLKLFDATVKAEIERVKNTTGLFTTEKMDNNIVHFSALPWVNFTSITQATNLRSGDSCPKFSVGKLVTDGDRKQMPLAVDVHHALVDGYHVGLFFDKLQELFDE